MYEPLSSVCDQLGPARLTTAKEAGILPRAAAEAIARGRMAEARRYRRAFPA